jgi:aminoglycoside 6'-N-acetyltransferase I
MDHLTIDRVGPGQASLLHDVADGVFNDPFDPDRLGPYFASPGTMLIVARDGGRVVGQLKAAIHLHPDKPADLYIDELVVAPAYQRRGIARRLLREAEQWARERGCADVWLATAADNGPAHALYGRFAASKPCLLYYWDL